MLVHANTIITAFSIDCWDGHNYLYLCVYMTSMQSITQSAERLVMEEELKKALDRCKEWEQSSVPAVDGVDIFECYQLTGEGRVLETGIQCTVQTSIH